MCHISYLMERGGVCISPDQFDGFALIYPWLLLIGVYGMIVLICNIKIQFSSAMTGMLDAFTIACSNGLSNR